MPHRSSRSIQVPLSRWQAYSLAIDTDPACDDAMRRAWVMAQAVQVQPGIDMRRFRRAIDKLWDRHDLLRMRLVPAGADWLAWIDPRGKPVLHEIDLGDIEDAALMARIADITSAPMQLVEAPLAEIVIAHCGGAGDVVILRVHHAITDGFGMVVLVEDLLKYVVGIPILTAATSHLDYLHAYENLSADRRAAADTFWEEMHRDLAPLAPIGRHGRGLEPLWHSVGDYEAHSLDVRLTPKDQARVASMADHLGIGQSSLLFTAFLEAACAQFGQERMTYGTVVGRIEPRLASFMGHATHRLVLPYRARGEDGFDASARDLAATLLSAMENLPHEAARRGGPWQDRIRDRGIFTDQFQLRESGANAHMRRSLFGRSLDQPSQNFGPYRLTPVPYKGQLRSLSEVTLVVKDPAGPGGFQFVYDGQAYSAAEIGALADRICALVRVDRSAA